MWRYIKTVLMHGLYILYSLLTWMSYYARHPEKATMEKRYKKLSSLIKKVSKSLQVNFFVEGLENLPNEHGLIVSNHLSFFDPLAYVCVLNEPTTFVSKKEVEGFPFVGKCCKCISAQFMNRSDLKQSLKVMLNVEHDLEDNDDKNWIIFPEGTRNKDPMSVVMDFHHGTFKPAMRAKKPIIPSAIYGSFRALKAKPSFKKCPVYIKFLPPIMPEEYANMTTEEVAVKCHDLIQATLTYDLRMKDHKFMSKENKNYNFNQII